MFPMINVNESLSQWVESENQISLIHKRISCEIASKLLYK